jgi:hypothetical protein
MRKIEDELKGVSSSVTCSWSTVGGGTPSLNCNQKILVTANQISVISVTGLPTNQKVRVWVSASDEVVGKTEDLSYDLMDAEYRPTMLIEVYKNRWLAPTYGGPQGLRKGKAFSVLRRQNPPRRKLSILLTSNSQAIHVGVSVGDPGTADFVAQTSLINVVFERWGFETGGFIAFSTLTDDEIVTEPVSASSSKVKVLRIKPSERLSQETGVFLNLIPRNYPYVGIGLGFATNSGRNPSVYLGPTIRLIGLGERGLASFSAGIMEKQVKVFPGIAADSVHEQNDNVLKGTLETRRSAYFLINLGFTFGQIGNEGNGAGGTK